MLTISVARALLGKTYQQLGYASERSTGRNFYPTGARELIVGPPEKAVSREMLDMLKYTSTPIPNASWRRWPRRSTGPRPEA